MSRRRIDRGTEPCGCRYEGAQYVQLCPAHHNDHLAALAAHWAEHPEVVLIVPAPPAADNSDLL